MLDMFIWICPDVMKPLLTNIEYQGYENVYIIMINICRYRQSDNENSG